eukprot:1156186-Pelagomonas_calceolata.AAC.7
MTPAASDRGSTRTTSTPLPPSGTCAVCKQDQSAQVEHAQQARSKPGRSPRTTSTPPPHSGTCAIGKQDHSAQAEHAQQARSKPGRSPRTTSTPPPPSGTCAIGKQDHSAFEHARQARSLRMWIDGLQLRLNMRNDGMQVQPRLWNDEMQVQLRMWNDEMQLQLRMWNDGMQLQLRMWNGGMQLQPRMKNDGMQLRLRSSITQRGNAAVLRYQGKHTKKLSSRSWFVKPKGGIPWYCVTKASTQSSSALIGKVRVASQTPPPVCPNPSIAPPSLQVDPGTCPECPGGHLLRAGGSSCCGGGSKATRSADDRSRLSTDVQSNLSTSEGCWGKGNSSFQCHKLFSCASDSGPAAKHLSMRRIIERNNGT